MTNFKRLEQKFCIFVDYPNISCAEHAVSEMNGYRLENKTLLVRIREQDGSGNRKRTQHPPMPREDFSPFETFPSYDDRPGPPQMFPPVLVYNKIIIEFFFIFI